MKNQTKAMLFGALLICGGLALTVFGDVSLPAFSPVSTEDKTEIERLVRVQLGDLNDYVTEEEYQQVYGLMEELYPIKKERLEEEDTHKTRKEKELVERLNELYESYTVAYFEDGGKWGFDDSRQTTLAEYEIDHESEEGPLSGSVQKGERTDQDYEAMWDQILGILPDGAWEDFTKFTIFTDGPDQTLAWVWYVDDDGKEWELAVDPEDAGDDQWFTETILHEYCHYLTLNSDQVSYGAQPTTTTYNEYNMVSNYDSYINDFYQEFWVDYLDDRLADTDSYNFFLRHYDDFVSDYASTDPAEDICESFTYFVLERPKRGGAVWEKKLNFFYDYPELVALRREIRTNLGLGT